MLFAIAIVGAGLAGFEDYPLLHPPFTSCLLSFMLFAFAIVGAGLAGFEDNPLLHFSLLLHACCHL